MSLGLAFGRSGSCEAANIFGIPGGVEKTEGDHIVVVGKMV